MTAPRMANVEELLDVLDSLGGRSDGTAGEASPHWAKLLLQPDHPLHTDAVSSYLPHWLEQGIVPPLAGLRVLDVGCGLGRDARWFARHGAHVTAVDAAVEVVEEARRRTPPELAPGSPEGWVEFCVLDALRDDVIPGSPFHVVHDSGFFHHVSPPRRISYVRMLDRELLPGGFFAVCTFAAGQGSGAAEDPDEALLLRGHVGEGIAYTIDELSCIFGREPGLMLLDAGPLPPARTAPEPTFSQAFLQAAVFRRPA